MSLLHAANWYLCANVLLVLASVLLSGLKALSAQSSVPVSYRHQLYFGHLLAITALLLPGLGPLLGSEDFVPQAVQVWSASTMHADVPHTIADHRVQLALAPFTISVPLDIAGQTVVALFLAGLLLVLVRIAVDACTALTIIRNGQTIRRHGHLRILTSDHTPIPFSFWLPARYFIVVPSSLVLRPQELAIVLKHEAQHHRQLDTKMLYLYQLLQATFFWNPAAHLLSKRLAELQEFACDEAVTQSGAVSAEAYCRCLLLIAETAARQPRTIVRPSMIGGPAKAVLERRVAVILMRPAHRACKSAVAIAASISLALMTATAVALASPIHDQRISRAKAIHMAAIAQQDSAVPLVINHRVLEQLNLLLGTPDGRDYLRASVSRMRPYEAAIARQLMQYGMPRELLAVPLVESGYHNVRRTHNPREGAGLWRFIEPTARRFGLRIDEHNDERLDAHAETDAAMRYFASLHQRFNDWELTLLAYNAGEWRVEDGMRVTGSRDVWEITAHGYENDADYVPRVIAAILIMKNPSVLHSNGSTEGGA